MEKKKIILLTGPTAVGKTNLSIRLAKKLNAEIISADSMQVYRGMDIGTAKIKKEEMCGVRHALIDCLNPDDEYNVAIFQKLAAKSIDEICAKEKIPLIVGGTAFYIQALLYGIDFTEEEHDEKYRKSLYQLAKQEGGKEELYQKLQKIDPEYAATVHENNVKRVIRAIEYQHFTKVKFSTYNEEQKRKEAKYEFCYFALVDKRELLYQRINQRVDFMLEEGLKEEVENLINAGYGKSLVSMQGIGYKEWFDYFEGKSSLDDTCELIKKNTRHFAKRQLTWLRREPDLIFLNKGDYDNEDEILADMLSIIENKFRKKEESK